MLYDKSVVSRMANLEEKMGKIHHLAMSAGEVESDGVAMIESNNLINIRVLSRVD